MAGQQLPPPNKMIRELNTPNHAMGFFRELVSRDSPRFHELSPIKRGSLYSECSGGDETINQAFLELFFLKETVPIGSNTVAGMTQSEFVIWNWSTDADAESSFNAEISYLGDSTTNPVFARKYTIRREDYEATPFIATASPLTSLLGGRVLTGGTGYTHATVTLRGPGTGGKLTPVIADGSIVELILEEEGEGFDKLSWFQIIGDGTGATGQPIIQSVGTVLTSQKKIELPEGDPYSHEFVQVLRVYELLPGPWIPFTRYDDDLGPIQGRRRAVLNTGQSGGVITPTSKTNYEGRDGSTVVLIQLEENWSDGTGVGFDNPIYPKLFRSTYTDERGTVNGSSQVIVRPFFGSQATYVYSGIYTIKTWYEPYQDNPYLSREIIETWVTVTKFDGKYSPEFGGGIMAITEEHVEPGSESIDYGLIITESELVTRSPHEQVKRNEFLATGTSWPILPGCHTDSKTGIVLNYTKQVIDANAPVPPRSGYRGPFVEDQTYDFTKKFRIITAPDITTLPGPEAWVTTRQFSLPPTLLSIEAVWSDQLKCSSTGDPNSVSVAASAGNQGGVLITARNGFRGHVRCVVGRFYKYGSFLTSEVPTVFKIMPSSGSIVFTEATSQVQAAATDDNVTGASGNSTGYSFSHNGGTSGFSFQQRIHEVDIRDHLIGPLYNGTSTATPLPILNLHGSRPGAQADATSGGGTVRNVGLAPGFALPWGARMEVRLPESTPTPFQLGRQPNNQILVDVEVEEWGYGIWVMHCYYVDLTGIV